MKGLPVVSETSSELRTSVQLTSGGSVEVVFAEQEVAFRLKGISSRAGLGVRFEWVSGLSAFQDISDGQLRYHFRDFDYSVRVANATAAKTANGVGIVAGSAEGFRLRMAQMA